VHLEDTHLEVHSEPLVVVEVENLSGLTGQLSEGRQLQFLGLADQVQVLLTQVREIEGHHKGGEEAPQEPLQSLLGGQLNQLRLAEQSSEHVREYVVYYHQHRRHQHPHHSLVHVHYYHRRLSHYQHDADVRPREQLELVTVQTTFQRQHENYEPQQPEHEKYQVVILYYFPDCVVVLNYVLL